MIKLISLNIEGDKHFSRFLPFLQSERADIICLQEVFAADVPMLENEIGLPAIYAPMVKFEQPNQYGISPRGKWGVAVFSKLPIVSQRQCYYVGQPDKIPVFIDGQPNSASRVVIIVKVQQGDEVYTVATTHFTWSVRGQSTDLQRTNLLALKQCLAGEKDLIIVGDFNSPRGGDTYNLFLQEWHDCLPSEVTSTLDPNLHYAAPLNLVVDSIFSTGKYQVSNVRTVAGVSDHQAIIGQVSVQISP